MRATPPRPAKLKIYISSNYLLITFIIIILIIIVLSLYQILPVNLQLTVAEN
jgi:pilus assembly protein TadC